MEIIVKTGKRYIQISGKGLMSLQGLRNRDITEIHSLRENRIVNVANGKWGVLGTPGKEKLRKLGADKK